VQTEQCEVELFGGDQFRHMNESELLQYLQNWFSSEGWPPSAFQKWSQIYSDSLSKSSELALYGFLTDIYMTCGNQQVAVEAAKSFKSPVYLGIVTYAPSHPHPGGGGLMRYPFHTWDYEAATQSWHWMGSFNPQKSDIVFGETQLDIWYEIASTGKVSHGWDPVNADPSFPASFTVGVEQYPDRVSSVKDYWRDVCQQLADPPLNMNINFWIVNK